MEMVQYHLFYYVINNDTGFSHFDRTTILMPDVPISAHILTTLEGQLHKQVTKNLKKGKKGVRVTIANWKRFDMAQTVEEVEAS